MTRKTALALGIDLAFALATVPAALFLRLGHSVTSVDPILIAWMMGSYVAIAAAVFLFFGTHRGVWRYTSVDEMIRIAKAAAISVLIFLPILFISNRLEGVPRSVPIIQGCLLIILIGGSRIAYRLFRQRNVAPRLAASKPGKVPVLLLGLGDEAEQFIRAIQSDPEAVYDVVGLLDRPETRGRWVHGIPVFGGIEALDAAISQLAAKGIHPQRLILADPNVLDQEVRKSLLEIAAKRGLTAAKLPRMTELQDASTSAARAPRPIALEDLLGRPQIELNKSPVQDLIRGSRVMVTGAGGTIGGELCRQVAALQPDELILLDHSEFSLYSIDIDLREKFPALKMTAELCNIRERDRVMNVFDHHRPTLVFHAAALKHVPIVEAHPSEGVLTNTLGTKNVADAAARFGAKAMVQVSTDKAVNPTSVMGASKRLAELYTQSLDLEGVDHQHDDYKWPRFMTVRFGNVLGSSGSVVPLFQKQLAAGGPLTVTHPDMRRFFMTVYEAVSLVLQAAARGVERTDTHGQIFVLDMGEPIKIDDVAKQIIRLAGLRPGKDIAIQYSGLRPGEKLYEECFNSAEERLPSLMEKVQIATSNLVNKGELLTTMNKLAIASTERRDGSVKHLLSDLLPDSTLSLEPTTHRVSTTESAAPSLPNSKDVITVS